MLFLIIIAFLSDEEYDNTMDLGNSFSSQTTFDVTVSACSQDIFKSANLL